MQIQINTWQVQTGWFHPYMGDFFEYISLSAIRTADCEWNCMVEEIRAIVSPANIIFKLSVHSLTNIALNEETRKTIF